MLIRHIRDVAAMCCPNPTGSSVRLWTNILLEEINEDRLIPLVVNDILVQGILTEDQIIQTGVAPEKKFQACGHKEGETPLTPYDCFLRSSTFFVSKPAVESWARHEEIPFNTKGWQ